MREESVNCPLKVASNEATSETHVSAMSDRVSRALQQAKMCGCLHDDASTSTLGLSEHEMSSDEHRIPGIHNLGFTTNGKTVTSQKKYRNINEMLHRQVPGHEDVNMNVSCPRICIDSTKENHQLVSVDSDSQAPVEEDLSPVIRLSLRKPPHWKWKLTTSASSPAIILPVIRLLDEKGDLLLDTGEKSESGRRGRTMFSSMRVDSNGNERVRASGLTHSSNRSGRCDAPCGDREIEQLNSGTAEDVPMAGSQTDGTSRKVTLHKERQLVIAERDGPEETLEMWPGPAGRKTRKARCSRSKMGHGSGSNGSVRGSRSKGTPRNKTHHRILDRRRNRGHSSTSSDSSPEAGCGTRRRTGEKGRTAFCARHAPLFSAKFRQNFFSL
jgi:hypothetical protein